jgi:hypothetical protein
MIGTGVTSTDFLELVTIDCIVEEYVSRILIASSREVSKYFFWICFTISCCNWSIPARFTTCG